MSRLPALLLSLCAATAGAQSINPEVTQANIGETICTRGWTKTVRPTWAYTSHVKHELCVAHGMRRCAPGLILDHIIPIEAGGSPDDPANFQLQTWEDSVVKDLAENQARRDICAHRASLAEAQARFHRDTQ